MSRVLVLVVALALLGGCTAGQGERRSLRGRTHSPQPATPTAKPWPDRPEVHLTYDVAADHQSVQGVERIRFTPDLRVCHALVFRAWPNKPGIADDGGSLRVRHVRVDGRTVRPRVEAKGAPHGTPGTLVRVPLRHCVGAGHSVTARLAFTVVMAEHDDERVGTDGSGEMWFASAFPVLGWERGHGWMTEPAVNVFGEMQGSEEFRLSLAVVAPSKDTVLGTGHSVGTAKGPRPGTTVHKFTAVSVRNVAVSVGDYRVLRRTVDGVRVRVGVHRATAKTDARGWMDKIAIEIPRLERYFGSFPYRDLWVTVIPKTTGIEFPGAIFYGNYPPGYVATGGLVGHELAHMWFYGLVGDDQARNPWLDESFAQYAQELADGGPRQGRTPATVPPFARDRVGAPMSYWARRPNDYGVGVYGQGARMLFQARSQAGTRAWDAAVRAYIRKNAHRIARPKDFKAAVAGLPHAVETLRHYGAVR